MSPQTDQPMNPASPRFELTEVLQATSGQVILGERVVQALISFTLPPMRWEVHRLGEATLINDAYNANPQFMRAALTTVCEQPGARRIVVFGGMRELGEQTEALHQELGRWLASKPLDWLLTVGALARGIADGAREGGAVFPIEPCAEVGCTVEQLRSILRPGDLILLKGSRLEGLERIASSLLHD